MFLFSNLCGGFIYEVQQVMVLSGRVVAPTIRKNVDHFMYGLLPSSISFAHFFHHSPGFLP